ncbi:MAG TPA: MotA/TolQ/ExbB proton channel family protein [Sedimentisphaerales bacterium]|nr:MotA/TolQ/ExbB proton channel family protein [Phycisphaerae bacterium]HON91934.1 MotA/TolQ/ExbB proton channel family protein [Sedimentisphaerales bacterium]HOV78389.1 MotA/TolQ/ExbB proton channel family protein [Sedimentisphaerales bacterium]HQG48440.1 MotA/TolQ/ExbB proton channel family protein [Sedimentisphaerales bacterium]
MDIATILGIVSGCGVIIWAMALGGSLVIFWDVPSVAITVGGMLASTFIQFSLPQCLSILSVVKKTFVTKIPTPSELIKSMVEYATINRRDGALALEQEVGKLKDTFFAKALQLIVDGQSPDDIRDFLSLEIQYMQDRHAVGKKILEYMGAAAPAFGMVGTLIGLVQMLRNLSSPDQIGAGMAVALLTTFYGAVMANLIFLPLAGKLSLYSKAETTSKEMIVEGICAIAKGDNPTVVREKLQVFLSQGKRTEKKA